MAEAAAAFVVKMLAVKGVEAAVVAAAVNVAVNVAAYAAVNAITRQNSEQKQQGGLIDLQLNSSAPRQLVIGKRMTGGVLVDWYLAGTNNTKLYMPVYLSEGPCGQVTRVFADGREVWNTPLVHGVRTTIPDFRSGGDRLWLTYYDGRVGQTADATLVALGQGWTSANTMTGCAYVVVECQWDSDNMRSPPSLSFEMEGAKLYDRRLDTTAGGSGSHRIDDPATWAWSDNPMVALDHFLLGRYWGSARTFGIGLSADEVPYSYFAAQANICDENVTLKAGGTQKRYRANGFIAANEDYATTITRLCTAMAARPADFGGRFGVIGVESKTPVLTIDDGDLIAGVQEVYTPKRSWSELVGEVEGRFQDPAQLYQPTPYPNVTDATWADEDGGEPKLITFDLEFETHVERAQRLATLKARAERRQATLNGSYPLWTIELEHGDWFVRTGAKWGVDGKTFEVVERVLDPATYTVNIVAQEVDATDSAWDETTASDGPPAPLAPTDTLSAIQVPAITVTAITLAGTASSIPALKVAWTAPTDPRVRFMYVEVENVDGVTPKTTRSIALPVDVSEVVVQDGIVDGDSYAISAKFLTDTIHSDWCVAEIEAASGTYAVGTAASVAWSGVTGSGKPADNATVGARSGTNLYRTDGTTVLTQAEVRTAEGTAAAITGQGWGATASEANASNANVPIAGFNRNPTFQAWASTLPDNWTASGTPTITKNTTNKIYGAHCLDMTVAASGSQWVQTTSATELRAPDASTYVTIEWEVELVSGDFKRAGLWFRKRQPDSSNYNSWRISFYDEHGASPAAGKYAGSKTFAANLPAGSPSGNPASADLYLMGNWSSLSGGADSAKQIRWHRVLVRPATQQEIAAALALQNDGKLSSTTGVFGTDLKETSGGTVATLANFKTSSGTAAAIASQGALATANNVNTSTIASNAVTAADDDETDAGATISSSWVSVASADLTTADAASRALIMFSAYIAGTADGSIMDARIKRDATVIWGPKLIAGRPSELAFETTETGAINYTPEFNGMVSFFDTDVPGAAGTYTYSIELRVSDCAGSNPWDASYRRMFAMVFKR